MKESANALETLYKLRDQIDFAIRYIEQGMPLVKNLIHTMNNDDKFIICDFEIKDLSRRNIVEPSFKTEAPINIEGGSNAPSA